MLKTQQYYGILEADKLIGIGGVHVYSEEYRVAALGNVTIHPRYRNKGLGKQLISHLCQKLRQKVDHIGLNVAIDNVAAIKCYKDLGFEIVGEYEETMLSYRS